MISGEVAVVNAKLALETGATDALATYSSGSGTNTLVFNYTVGASDTSMDLDYASTSSLAVFQGTKILVQGNPATLVLPAP